MRRTIAMVVGCLLTVGISHCARADTWTGQDKIAHAAVSSAVASLTSKTHGAPAGFALALLPGLVKELSDLSGSGTPSVKDMGANMLGALVGSVLPRQYMLAPIAPRGVVQGVSLFYVMEL